MNLQDLYYFVKAVDHGGFTAAARALDLPKSTLSRRVAALENALGTRLVERSTRQFVVTELGREFYRHAQAMVLEAEAAESVVRGRISEPRGQLRITCSIGMAHFALAELLPRFQLKHPQVTLVHAATNRIVDIVEEGYDIALRAYFGQLPNMNLIQHRLADVPWQLVASPEWIEKAGRPVEPDDLTECAGIAMPRFRKQGGWEIRSGMERQLLRFTTVFESDDMKSILCAAAAGLGVAALPGYVCRAGIRSGQLRRVLPAWAAGDSTISALMPRWRGRLPAVRAFIGFLESELSSVIETEADQGE